LRITSAASEDSPTRATTCVRGTATWRLSCSSRPRMQLLWQRSTCGKCSLSAGQTTWACGTCFPALGCD
jgi:hypothetical protein